MKTTYLILITFLIAYHALNAQQIRYSPAWFGPNANPVPEFSDARIPSKTTFSLTADYYHGYGDQTMNGYFKVEIPLLTDRVSIKLWSTVLEHYQVNSEVYQARNMSGDSSGRANGDLYLQTRILLLSEQYQGVDIIFNSTLKTASGTKLTARRYYDTPGYYFDLEIGKSIYTRGSFINEIRGVVNMGFLCWETTNSTQNDAPMYGGKLIIGNNTWKFENTISGYWGWMHTRPQYGKEYGDAPLVYTTKISITRAVIDYFVQYQYGIKDFPYQQFRIGVNIRTSALTPNYRK